MDSVLFKKMRSIHPLFTSPIIVVWLLGLVFRILGIPDYILEVEAGYFALRFSQVLFLFFFFSLSRRYENCICDGASNIPFQILPT